MSKDVFDPTVHKVVAVVAKDGHPEKGTHVHVTLEELARDAREIEAPTVFHAPEAPAIDLQPVLAAIANLADRVAALEIRKDPGSMQVPAAVQPSLGLEPIIAEVEAIKGDISVLTKHLLSQEEWIQKVAQSIDDQQSRITIIEKTKVPDLPFNVKKAG